MISMAIMATQTEKVVASLVAMATQTGKAVAGLTVVFAMFQNYFPCELRVLIMECYDKFVNFVYPYIQITFPEFQGDGFRRSKAYSAIERYLNTNSTKQAKRLQAYVVDDCDAVVLSVTNNEEVADEFKGIKLWWTSAEHSPTKQSISFWPREDEKKYFRLTFYRKHRHLVTTEYIKHVLDQGKAITVQERRRKLCTNKAGSGGGGYGFGGGLWSQVVFEHPATFPTLAMDPVRKQRIVNDLLYFSKSEEYYKKVGKAWKRGYLLYGPPGTGKSTMIAAMANLLQYDVYDLELTAVDNNTELRKLLINTTSKSIIVIEDIDCSIDVTAKREDDDDDKEEDKGEAKDPVNEENKKKKKKMEKKRSNVTLSGLLNTIDGLWSACPGERIIVFTTNHVEKLDKALIRRGRMDEHIELSYCGFEAFKILAKNYLDIDSHELFAKIRQLLKETEMTPADVADKLMLKSDVEDADTNLLRLIKALEEAKEEARRKAEEEDKNKADKLAKQEEQEKKVAEEKARNGSTGDQSLDNGVKENGHN
ncbi:AAA-ATPase ASD, mitochondrial-like [Salvia miltiorrhiza]|uniref:AAA-ATPase ASD, mitochondrial-like n=1 Tax=Salvia miltiorrhiza TaxID=226208 RepID=UPI0025AD47B9|nr:AAA-ATPase ASD, mitochondrial-like [Salvia miltiorrhiza]